MSTKLSRRVAKDEVYLAFKRIVSESKSSDYDSFVKELKQMHKGRAVRGLNRKMRPDRIIDAAGQDQGYRSRAAEIMMNIAERTVLLEKAYENTRSHIASKYPKSLAVYKTKGERDQAIRGLLAEAKDVMTKLKLVDKIAGILMEDIDKAVWPIKYALKRYEMINQKENRAI